jgi:hypothetical protein
MPSTERASGADDAVVAVPALMLDRLVAALERLATSQSVEAAAEFRNALATETNAAIARWQSEALLAIADRMNPPEAFHQRGRELSTSQRQVVLRYDAFRTALGRTGAASVVVGAALLDENLIAIVEGAVPDIPLTLVAFGGRNGAEVGRGALSRDSDGCPRQASIGNLREKHVTRFELWDHAGTPLLFGLLAQAQFAFARGKHQGGG